MKLHKCNIIRLIFVPIALILDLVLCSYLASVYCTRDVSTTADESVVFGSRADTPSQLDDHASDNVLVVSGAAHHVHHLPTRPYQQGEYSRHSTACEPSEDKVLSIHQVQPIYFQE